MAMVRQLTEGEMINGSTPEDDSATSEPVESCNSRPSSRASSGSKKSASPIMPSLQYSKDDLMKYSNTPLSKNRPSCLDPAYNNSTGKWDPERWFMNHRSDRLSSLDESRTKRDRQDDGLVSHKRKSSDPKERIKEEKDDIVLSPQRRSFGTGCHVIQQSSLARRPGSPLDRDENFREPSRRIGSGRIMTRDRDQRDWDRDREYGYGRSDRDRRDRFDPDDDKDLRRFSGGSRYSQRDRRSRGGSNHGRIDEVEPEWFSSGPTSQSETIELVGFEDQQHDGDTRKTAKKKRKQNSRRSSLKLEDGEKIDSGTPAEEKPIQKKSVSDFKQEEPQNSVSEKTESEETKANQVSNSGFEIDELFKMDWIPGLPLNEAPNEAATSELGCSRFSQWFRKESPVHQGMESANNSRRSSLHDELIANVLNSIVEPQIMIPSPTQQSDNFFAPISPALSHSSGFSLPQTMSNAGKDLMDMLQSAKANTSTFNGNAPKESVKTVKELEADLKRIVLGDKAKEEKSAFDKLLQHMSDSNSQTAPLSMGPLDKSKAVQEQDLLQDMLSSHTQQHSVSPLQSQFQMFEDKQTMFKLPSGIQPPSYNQSSQNEAFAQLMQQKQHEQHLQQMQQQLQQQLQNQLQQHAQPPQHANSSSQGNFTADMLAKILNSASQSPMSPVSPGLQSTYNQQAMTRNDSQVLNTVIQCQRQRELLSSLLKQQQQFPVHNVTQPTVLQQMQQRRCPSAKDMPLQQTLTLPTLGLSPRQSPLPSEAIGPMQNQGRIPSPLIFGQQPPALSHAPAPIHPAALVQAMSQNSVSPNTLQVQNPVVLQRVPSPQELAVHTQSILQNALIKRKLEEQKENFRKRQEAQRSTSPPSISKNGSSSSPHKGLSPTIAFTPTSVMRKIQSEKTENKEQKSGQQQQNGTKFPGVSESSRLTENSQILPKAPSAMPCTGIPTSLDSNFNLQFSNSQNNGPLQAPRAVHGQAINQSRFGGMNSIGSSMAMPNQGRPIVKVGMNQPINTNDLSRAGMGNKNIAHNKMMMQSGNNQLRSQNIPVPQQLQMAAAYASMGRPPPPLNHPNMMRPMATANAPASNISFPLLRNAVQNPIRAQNTSLNQLNHMNQLAALQMQRGAPDTRQLQALAQMQRLPPAALQQLLMNSQNQVAAAQAQVVPGFPGNRDSKHQHLLPGQPSTNRQSPVNLTKWFGNDVLKQKMPDMPPVPHQKALLVEEVERQQQQSTAVHN